jgi:hypothetical protein
MSVMAVLLLTYRYNAVKKFSLKLNLISNSYGTL